MLSLQNVTWEEKSGLLPWTVHSLSICKKSTVQCQSQASAAVSTYPSIQPSYTTNSATQRHIPDILNHQNKLSFFLCSSQFPGLVIQTVQLYYLMICYEVMSAVFAELEMQGNHIFVNLPVICCWLKFWLGVEAHQCTADRSQWSNKSSHRSQSSAELLPAGTRFRCTNCDSHMAEVVTQKQMPLGSSCKSKNPRIQRFLTFLPRFLISQEKFHKFVLHLIYIIK
jgi:hypothetical protein